VAPQIPALATSVHLPVATFRAVPDPVSVPRRGAPWTRSAGSRARTTRRRIVKRRRPACRRPSGSTRSSAYCERCRFSRGARKSRRSRRPTAFTMPSGARGGCTTNFGITPTRARSPGVLRRLECLERQWFGGVSAAVDAAESTPRLRTTPRSSRPPRSASPPPRASSADRAWS